MYYLNFSYKEKKKKQKEKEKEMLHNFGIGWRNLFEKHVEFVVEFISDVTISSIERYKGMLRIKFSASNQNIQYLLDSVSYKIERDSARTCEFCGNYGFRRTDNYLDESLCLCTRCYVKCIDDILTKQ